MNDVADVETGLPLIYIVSDPVRYNGPTTDPLTLNCVTFADLMFVLPVTFKLPPIHAFAWVVIPPREMIAPVVVLDASLVFATNKLPIFKLPYVPINVLDVVSIPLA